MTEAGFQFLLLDSYHQLWLLLKQYTEAEATRSGGAKGVLYTVIAGNLAVSKLCHIFNPACCTSASSQRQLQ